MNIMRMKVLFNNVTVYYYYGLLCIESSPVKVVLQCVNNELYELIPTSEWGENELQIHS